MFAKSEWVGMCFNEFENVFLVDDSSTLLLVQFQVIALQCGYALFNSMIENEFDLQFVFVVGVSVAQVPELFSLVKTPVQVLRSHKILGNLDAVVNISHLSTKNG